MLTTLAVWALIKTIRQPDSTLITSVYATAAGRAPLGEADRTGLIS